VPSDREPGFEAWTPWIEAWTPWVREVVMVNNYYGPPMTLGNAAAAHVRLIVWWCKNYRGLPPPRLGDLAGSRRSGFTPRATTDHRPLCL
jgi:hypothetical protein